MWRKLAATGQLPGQTHVVGAHAVAAAECCLICKAGRGDFSRARHAPAAAKSSTQRHHDKAQQGDTGESLKETAEALPALGRRTLI
jgi:hypothetical protein